MFLTIPLTLQKISAHIEFVSVSIHQLTSWHYQTDYDRLLLNLDQNIYMTLMH